MKTNLYFETLIAVSLAFAAVAAHAGTAAYYIYDEDGHVIGEYKTDGTPIQEHVYLDDRPVAVLQNGSTDYVSTDQLDTPRIITDSNKNVVWQWNSDPYGNGQPAGSLTYNLRFPGQYYDAETGHTYNYNRDYDPTTGRYTESDPIGLRGGINTYAYVDNNPLIYADPFGLAPPIPSPPSSIPGGPYTPAGPGQPPGTYYGPQQASGPRTQANYVPDQNNGGPPGAQESYWKVKQPGQGWQRYNNEGFPITPEQAHPSTCPVEEPPPVNPLWENPWLWFPLLLSYSSDAN